ncbi:Aspartyl/glutamyl-tRNA(Asn/Gln) amidotransferase subunit B [Planctomycetes bacterium Pan216]|uniref:Aspartyl/glutamyl-tRNA(Asn/Gln) amidotransferase subunit B n=1 Tax=Kolteria novifilia TaxID=2527975 RepID=A0A518B8D5_9BACT|nr:Aspartyl/glutamyl-tRNA(Asn/Gln) amidotransferase subunit B [Planctomycetes bacterium Pan216]
MSKPYKILIGLEVHAQLQTNTKLFSGMPTTFGMRPNSQTSPLCIGMPGTLPVMNKRAFELAMKAGLAFDCTLSRFTKWDRKQYYYPDLPKGYQISQYDLPFAEGGAVDITIEEGTKRVRLIRVHLEEDAGKNTHSDKKGGDSLVDLNRAGVPLIEIVSEPDMETPEEAKAYLETVRTLLRDLEVSDCEMQEGSLRCDANVNLHITKPDGTIAKTPIVEIKNMNSIRAVERALYYEADRQYELWQQDGKVMGEAPKQTRGWDDARGVTIPQREKEEASDYRYFPEPDLVPIVIDDAWIERIKAEMGETSGDRIERYKSEYGLSDYNADVLVTKGRAVSDYFEELLAQKVEPKAAANWTINDVLSHAVGRVKTIDDLNPAPKELAELIGMVKGKKLNLNDAREKVLPAMVESGKSAPEISKELGLEVVLDTGAIDAVCDEVINDPKMAKSVDDFKGGKEKAFGALMGQVMRRSQGKFPPDMVTKTLREKLTS